MDALNSSVQQELNDKHGALAALCRKYSVVSLDLFGSASTEDWQAEDSDLDFVVTFRSEKGGGGIADRYLGLAQELETLFGRPVDLLTPQSIRNPYLRRSIEATSTRVYAA